MDKEKVIIRLSTQIDTLKAHINRLKREGYKVHSLDVDMLRQKTIEFYEQVFELEELFEDKNEAPVKKTPVVEQDLVKEISEDVVIVEPKKEDIPVEINNPEAIDETQPEVEEPTPEPLKFEPKKDHKEKIVEEIPEPKIEESKKESNENTTEVKKEEKEVIKETPKQTTYDLFSEGIDNNVVEKYTTSDEQSIAEKMQKSHISNIREAIGINEKFLFINELFNGDMGRYNKILDDINDLPTRHGVETYLFELKIQFQWADDNEAYLKLKELMERKFS